MPNIFHNSLSLGYPQGGTYETDPYIPQMTDYTAPEPFVAKASSNWDNSEDTGGSRYNSWKAFDRITNQETNGCWVSKNNGATQWLRIDIGSGNETRIWKYRLCCRYDAGWSSPKNWTFEGSNDLSSWTTLHTVTNYTTWVNNTYYYWEITPSSAAYRYFRWYITASSGVTDMATLGEANIYRYLI